jgi:hypothetical protein
VVELEVVLIASVLVAVVFVARLFPLDYPYIFF